MPEDAPPPSGQPHKTLSDRAYYMFALKIIGDFGATIAVPVVALSWAGGRLDERWGTSPYLIIIGFALAAVLSGLMIYRKAKEYGKQYQELGNRR